MPRAKKKLVREYGWRPGYHTRGVSAADAASVVLRAGGDKAEIIRLSRPANAPTHKLFTWDNSAAAHRWRMREAANLCYAVAIVEVVDGKKRAERAFVGVEVDDEDASSGDFVFRDKAEAMNDPETCEKVLRQALMALVAWKARWGELVATSELAADVAEVIRKHNKPKSLERKTSRAIA